MKIEEILRRKGVNVVTISPSQSVLEAVRVLVDHNIGGVVVLEDGRLAGIFTERDILRLTAQRPGELGSVEVREVMTRDVVTATPQHDHAAMMDVMTERRIRHLPVLDRAELVGIVSIGDLLKACQAEAEQDNQHLREYISQAG